LLDEHPTAAPIALLAALQVAVDLARVEREPGWHSLQNPDERAPVGLAGGEVSQSRAHGLSTMGKIREVVNHKGVSERAIRPLRSVVYEAT
jgi:hypothetical protein